MSSFASQQDALPEPNTNQHQQSASPTTDPIASFAELSKNYLNMLATSPKETADTMKTSADAPLDLESILNDFIQDGVAGKDLSMGQDDSQSFPVFANAFSATQQPFLTSPLMSGDFDPTSPLFGSGTDFMSPSLPSGHSDFSSPLFADAHDFGSSPLLADNGGNFHDPLFSSEGTPPLVHDSSPLLFDSNSSPQLSTPQNAVGTYDAVIEDAPSLFGNFFDQSSFNGSIHPSDTQLIKEPMFPAEPIAPEAVAEPEPKPAPVVKPRRTQNRKVIATGTRKNLTPSSLVTEDAPTQTRKYALPSVTSRKEMPVTFARKRAQTAIVEGDEDFLPDLPPDATEKEQIEWKRRQNTIAARKSRKRKLEHQQWLEGEVEKLQRDRDLWKTRAMALRGVLHNQGDDGGMEDWEDEAAQ